MKVKNLEQAKYCLKSKKVRNGSVILTRDEYFADHNNYVKPKYKDNKKLYREAISVDSNDNGDMALIKIRSGGDKFVVNKSGQIERYSPHIKTRDNEGKPIRFGEKFVRGSSKYDVSNQTAHKMKMEAINHPDPTVRSDNRRKLNEIKKKKP